MKLRAAHLIYFFTGYSTIQLIGYLGTAYAWLAQPMVIFVLMMILFCVLAGVSEWTSAQSKQNVALPREQILSIFGATGSTIFVILFILSVGVWIAL